MNHGIATAKDDIGEIIKKGESGIITAYLPEMERFAVNIDFASKRWYTFEWSEKEFLKHFNVQKNTISENERYHEMYRS